MEMTAKALFDGHPDPMWVFDRSTLRVIDANAAAIAAFGYSIGTLRSIRITDLRPAEDRPRLVAALAAIGRDPVEAGIWPLITASGETRLVDIHWRPVSSEGTACILATFRDVTGLSRNIERLREQEINLGTVKRLLGVGFWQFHPETGTIDWSDNVYAIYGVAPNNFGKNLEDYIALIHPEDRATTLSHWKAFETSQDATYVFRHRVLRPDGGVVLVQGVGERSVGPLGPRVNGVVQDITRQAGVDEELARTSSLVRLAGAIARIGGWRISTEGPSVTWTDMTARIHGLDSANAPSINEGINHYAPEFRTRIRTAIEAGLRDGTPVDELVQLIRADGDRVWVRVIGEAEKNDRGDVVALQGAIQDVSEVVAVRAKAEASARRLAETMEQLGDALILLDGAWRYIYVNAEAERLLGRDRSQLLGHEMWSVFPDTVGTIFDQRFHEAVQTGRPARFTQYYEPFRKWLRISAHPASDRLAVYFTDVTAERMRDDQLRLLELAVGRVNDMVVITEPDPAQGPENPRIVYVNEAFVARTGYSRAEVIGRSPKMLQGPDTDPVEAAKLTTARARWEPVRAELLNYAKNGTPYWVEIDLVPLANDEGVYTHWVAVERDKTERRRAEEALRLSEERFRLVTLATEDVVWDYDVVAQRLWWGDGAARLLAEDVPEEGTSPDVWINHIHPDDRDRTLASIRHVIYGTGEHWRAEYRMIHADGKVLNVVDRGFVIRNAAGQALRMIGSISDVSGRVAMEERVRQSQKMEAVGQLTGGVAHDFNNLLTVIIGSVEELAHRSTGRTDLNEPLRIIQSAAMRAAELTSRLLAFARRQTLAPRIVDANDLIQGLEGLLRRTLTEDIEVRILTAPDLWTTEIDPGQLEVALVNLTINARDAMPRGGLLTLETTNLVVTDDIYTQHDEVLPRGSYVVISVSDTGTGMTRSTLARAFEPFFTTKEVGKGSGLGLSMVYGFVRQSQGHVRMTSEPGVGTVVKLYFPRAAAANAPAKVHPDPAPELAASGSHRILVVEDDPLVRNYVVGLLGGLGYQVTACENGAAGLAALRSDAHFDLLFTDVVMPGGIGGQELAEAASLLRPGISVLFTSGYTEDELPARALGGHRFHMLPKPYRRRDLVGLLQQILANGS
jgi:PAS domain S-box-containing protein